jgi:hypothetical protein
MINKLELTEASLALFIAYAKDAGNWSGTPMIGGSAADRGNLTDLKKKGLVTTFRDEGCDFVCFTDEGIKLAAAHGVTILV